MSEDSKEKGVDDLFSGIEFLSGLFAKSTVLGCVFTALLIAAWIWYAIARAKMEWKDAVKKASKSLSAVAGESQIHSQVTNAGDGWETGSSSGGGAITPSDDGF